MVFANDIDPQKVEMYLSQFPDARSYLVEGDIKSILPSAIPPVDVATVSFPCTDLSLAGARSGLAGSSSSAFWSFMQLLENVTPKPAQLLIENVPGFLSSGKGADLLSALRALNDLNYSVDLLQIDANHFVPQSRPRLFILAVEIANRKEVRERRSQQPGFLESECRPAAVSKFIFDHPGIIWHTRELPDLPPRKRNLHEIIEDLPEDNPQWWSNERVDYLLSQMSFAHRDKVETLRASPAICYATVFRRIRNGRSMAEVRTDGIAGCLRTPKGGSARQILLACGCGRIAARLVSPLECARLMGAKEFPLKFPTNQLLFGFGDAVCVDVIEWIGKNYLEPNVIRLKGGH